MTRCPCGCDREVKPGRIYGSRGCAWRGNRAAHMTQIANLSHRNRDPEAQRRAAAAARKKHQQAMLERAKGLTGQQGLVKGYRAGYHRAYYYWKAWAKREVANARKSA
jgi:hypothetical protein